MDKNLLPLIKRIALKTRRKSSHLWAGDIQSWFKGTGLDFEEVRPYVAGDDVRRIDWNVSAKLDRPYIKLFREEKDFQAYVALDTSISTSLGGSENNKREMSAQIASFLTQITTLQNFKTGLVLFENEVTKIVRPQKKTNTLLTLITEIVSQQYHPLGRTELGPVVDFFMNHVKKRSFVFLVSDFLYPLDEKALKRLARKHELRVIIVSHPLEVCLKSYGLVHFVDPETGVESLVDLSPSQIKEVNRQQENYYHQCITLLRRNEIKTLHLKRSQSILEDMISFFSHAT